MKNIQESVTVQKTSECGEQMCQWTAEEYHANFVISAPHSNKSSSIVNPGIAIIFLGIWIHL